jgi:ABC-type bacteriocin/lantibiotic exporter with double-glycine peptidase domain
LESLLRVEILPQPDDTACGPTCLHALYRYYGDQIPLERVISEVTRLEEGGTVACQALRLGYQA